MGKVPPNPITIPIISYHRELFFSNNFLTQNDRDLYDIFPRIYNIEQFYCAFYTKNPIYLFISYKSTPLNLVQPSNNSVQIFAAHFSKKFYYFFTIFAYFLHPFTLPHRTFSPYPRLLYPP